MQTYKVGHIFTHERAEIQAESFDEACQKLGWLPSQCWFYITSDIDPPILTNMDRAIDKQLDDLHAMRDASRIKG